ncbi:ACR258Wp [Eremothecium gossypii ATCC 10895]|uniref:Dynein heavy chain, cytoplasmic n=1 Tax=Eremothecium gossypii (strain ATCC 10895 / CBS 109.51 / FGSC 9923 / NRRL Y-1056) TaxID=284811 RepID=DYHC_EREGS|nr:ACR258Wp [Eremothecium gossypii ATCC 10895]Q9C1M7.1 RecName: Full=Dynein heavy chain, cytoplasmic; AltName: Full=Dynein heavy chain, cytosolic; Short=DYHC [Eremothecium gossypii ATCC 10895]AAK20175.1 dynein heavy chain 1 [Eremothecium gossypii]AAS51484.1 ACR258Wp [Eremothecium gossypii ATCC 10895]
MTDDQVAQALVGYVFNVAKLFLKLGAEQDAFARTHGAKFEEWVGNGNMRTLFLVKDEEGEVQVLEELEGPEAEGPEQSGRLLLIKNRPFVDGSAPMESQVQVLHLPPRAHFDGFKSFVSFGVATMFDAVVSTNSNLEAKQESINSARRKIKDLSLSLQSLQQFIEVPDISATAHPLIKKIIAEGANPRNYTTYISDEQFADSQFLNSLQKIANGWIKSAQNLTKLTRNIEDGSATDEIRFWINLEQSLLALEKQIAIPEVEITLSILTAAKRFHATVTFISDTGLRDRILETQSYNQIMSDFPLADLQTATSFTKLGEAIESISIALKKLKVSTYPLARAVTFVEKISTELDQKLREMLPNLISSDFISFQEDYDHCIKIINQWEALLKEFTSLIRELMRKRSEKFIFMKIDTQTDSLKEVLNTVAAFRKKHDILIHVLKGIGYDTLSEDIQSIYEPVQYQDPLRDNASKWANAEAAYNQRVSLLENKLVDMLKKKLDDCKSSDSMFSIFEKYRPLMKRPRIQGAVREYQHELLHNVKDDLEHIHQQLSLQKWNSELSRLNDIPPVSASIIWSKQLTKKLQNLTSRLGLILGEDWISTSEGSQIFVECSSIMKVLNTDKLFETWVSNVSSQNFLLDEPIFKILITNEEYELHVNFDSVVGSLFKEVRNLMWMGFNVPSNIIKNSRRVRSLYPHAVMVSELLQTFVSAVQSFQERPHTWLLLKDETENIWQLLSAMITDTWDSVPLFEDDASHERAEDIQRDEPSILRLEHSIGELLSKFQQLDGLEKGLSSCLQQLEVFGKLDLQNLEVLINKIQLLVDQATLHGFHNMSGFIDYLNTRIRSYLVSTVSKILEESQLSPKKHYILQQGKKVTISPSIEETKKAWMRDFQKTLEVATNLPKITDKKFDITEGQMENFTDIGTDLSESLIKAFLRIEDACHAIDEHFQKWKKLELLWCLDELTLLERLGSDVEVSYRFLLDFMEERKAIDMVDSEITIAGDTMINNEQVYVRVSAKYDNWQRVLCEKLLENYMDHASEFDTQLVHSRRLLETSIINLGSLSKTTELIAYVDDIKNNLDLMFTRYSLLLNTQKLLQKLRFRIPQNFIHAEQIESDLVSLREICLRKEDLINKNRDAISNKLEAELLKIQEVANSLSQSWSKKKPLSVSIQPSEALSVLNTFEDSIAKVNTERELINRAAKILLVPIKLQNVLSPVIEEVNDYKAVWSSVDGLWNSFNATLSVKWADFESTAVKHRLEALMKKCQDMPPKVLQYKIFQNIAGSIEATLKSMHLLKALKEPAIKPRHWSILFKQLGASHIVSGNIDDQTFTLEDILQLNILLNEVSVKKIVIKARNENVLESSLSQMKARWRATKFDQFVHSSGLVLVKGWDVIFSNCNDDLNMITSMKNSPYFKVFEQEALEWETKLSNFYDIVLSWVEVQRQWMYLFGILAKKTEMKNLLPIEASKFASLTSEYNSLLLKLYGSEIAIDILHVHSTLPTLKRMAESLTKIRKSLNDFLETQRRLFPRFYFVGNEDLLQIIGAGDNFSEFSRHLSKLFSSVSDFIYDESLIQGVYSLEGETLLFANPVRVTPSSKLDQWMNEVDLEIKLTLSTLVKNCLESYRTSGSLKHIIEKYPFQALLLALQCTWTNKIETSMTKDNFGSICSSIDEEMASLAAVIDSYPTVTEKRKVESLIVELVHLKTITETLKNVELEQIDFHWKQTQRFYWDDNSNDPLNSITIEQSCVSFCYGFEYIGVPERLIYTPLLDSCFNAMVLALSEHMGGCPFGPAGTGKTETIKALGQNFGRMVLVFNCDDSFDFQAMSRLLFGITQVGAWGCFDEFNRLEEKILSAVSTQVEAIQLSLVQGKPEIEVLDKKGSLNSNTGIFITMNPGYAGRSELPENLKKMFREFAMMKPDALVIAEVILTILGLENPRVLAEKIVSLFKLLNDKTTSQKHYDFGLRALKSVLRNCLTILRSTTDLDSTQVLLRSLNEMVVPKLISVDEAVYEEAIADFFPGSRIKPSNEQLLSYLASYCESNQLVASDLFIKKCSQFYDIQKTQQAIILAGDAGTGKTSVWKSVINSMKRSGAKENIVYIIDTKTLKKEDLYGKLDPVTFDWKDGIFTHLLRKTLLDTMGNFKNSNIWIVFDSDLDPNYTETLNSVLDDNKVLTLPNGERLKIPPNLHILFEVQDLEHATAATVSRCGMIWFANNTLAAQDILISCLSREVATLQQDADVHDNIIATIQDIFAQFIQGSTLGNVIEATYKADHIMGVDFCRFIETAVTLLSCDIKKNKKQLSRLSQVACVRYMSKRLALVLIWAFVGGSDLETREKFSETICELLGISDIPTGSKFLLDYDVSVATQDWVPVSAEVPKTSLESHEVLIPDLIIPTVDTVRHETLLFDLLNADRPLILCGPPGSGKTMTLYNTLKRSDRFNIIGINFSKDTSVELFLKTLEQHTICTPTSRGIIMQPKAHGKQLVVFCDEINLPMLDEYGSQPVILFLRQLIEKRGFWNVQESKWVFIERIQIVGACNPPGHAGRVSITPRFLRHASIVMVDYPGQIAMEQIYETFFNAIFKLTPKLKGFASDFTKASLQVYYDCKATYTSEAHSHYIYSPRELTRWVRGIHFTISDSGNIDLAYMLELWAHESLRLFSDRLVSSSEKNIFQSILQNAITTHFPNQPLGSLESSQLLFSNWLSLNYSKVVKSEMYTFIKERLKTFAEEELDTELTIYDDMIDNILRIDRILKQVQGHGILVGPNYSGKTTITRFVAWMNGIKVVRPTIHRHFTIENFDEFLKQMLLRCGTESEKICLIIDESNILETSFLERMNTLLANSDVPGLFEADEYEALLSKIGQRISQLGLLLDTEQEMYDWFTSEISKNLHVIFNINDPDNRESTQLITSPALFNRSVINWIGTWSSRSCLHVVNEVIKNMPLDRADYTIPHHAAANLIVPDGNLVTIRDVVANLFVLFHEQYHRLLGNSQGSPSAFLTSLRRFQSLYMSKLKELEEHQRFTLVGLEKLKDTVIKVKQLNQSLSQKQVELQQKEKEARDTLDKMLVDQNEAERKQEASVEIQKILALQEKEINERRKIIMADLAVAEPAILEAQRGVKNIKKQQFTELRSMLNPPDAVKTTLEAVCVILGYSCKTWKDIQLAIRKDEFVTDIVYYNTETMMTPAMKQDIETDYLSRPKFNYESVNRASLACGPLYQWIVAQISYSEMLVKVTPLKEEMVKVENEMLQNKARLMAAGEMIKELQTSIESSKVSYSKLIREVEITKTEMESVQSKVERSIKLMESLTGEKERWIKNTEHFKDWNKNLIGNCFLSSLYESYCGPHDQSLRLKLFTIWSNTLAKFGIEYEPTYSFITDMVNPLTKVNWVACGLPDNELFVANFHIAMNSCHYPYVIDPSSTIVDTFANFYGRKMMITSFLDVGFVKQLENALRFGGCILIQDGEFFDPIISHLIAKEFKKAGGRLTVQIGDHEVDVSTSFQLIIHSKDPNSYMSSFVKTRMAVINFTVSKGSIEAQALQITLEKENPELQKQRTDLLKLNGEYKLHLRSLEDKLLESLNESDGSILENDSLISTLEQLKIESSEIAKKIEETNTVIVKVEDLVNEYNVLGEQSVLIFNLLESITQWHWFYQIPIEQFMECFSSIFATKTRENMTRSEHLLLALYEHVYMWFSHVFKDRDRMAFGILLFASYHHSRESKFFSEHFWKIIEGIASDTLGTVEHITDTKLEQLVAAANEKDYLKGLKSLLEFLPESSWHDSVPKYQNIIVACERGVDGTFKVQQLAQEMGKTVHSVALGSAESISMAEQDLIQYSGEGKWLLLQNLQMSHEWANTVLPKKLESIKANPDFRVFMTCGIQSKPLVVPLLSRSYKIAYEGEPGVLNTVCELWRTQSEELKNVKPVEKLHSKFILVWFHSIIMARCRLAPIGFTKKYDFHDGDFHAGSKFLDHIFEQSSNGKEHVDPDLVPWKLVSDTIGKIIYGGKVDDPADLDWCKRSARRMFSSDAYLNNFEVVQGLTVPIDRSSYSQYDKWFKSLDAAAERTTAWLELSDASALQNFYAHEARMICKKIIQTNGPTSLIH